MNKLRERDLNNFWARVDKEGPEVIVRGRVSKCWMWQGSQRTTGGYGNFWSVEDSKNHLAHKWLYEKHVNIVPQGMVLDHLCDNGPIGCVNYDHVTPTTIRNNVLRGVGITAINAAKTHCIHGHLITGRRWYNGREERYCQECRSQYIQSDEYKAKKKEADKVYAIENKESIAKYAKKWREEKKNDPEYMAQMKVRKKLLEQQRMADPEYKAAYNLRKKLSRKPKNKKVV